jgi:hypothetical protein
MTRRYHPNRSITGRDPDRLPRRARCRGFGALTQSLPDRWDPNVSATPPLRTQEQQPKRATTGACSGTRASALLPLDQTSASPSDPELYPGDLLRDPLFFSGGHVHAPHRLPCNARHAGSPAPAKASMDSSLALVANLRCGLRSSSRPLSRGRDVSSETRQALRIKHPRRGEGCRLPDRARAADAYRSACSPCGAPGPGGSSISPRVACLPHRSQRRSGPMLPPQPAWRVSRGGPPGVG